MTFSRTHAIVGMWVLWGASVAVACSLNPQPLPPDNAGDAGGFRGADSSPASALDGKGGSPEAEGNPPGEDAGGGGGIDGGDTGEGDASGDDATDGEASDGDDGGDGGDASDAGDAPDATDATDGPGPDSG
jgi:hypothetical protein